MRRATLGGRAGAGAAATAGSATKAAGGVPHSHMGTADVGVSSSSVLTGDGRSSVDRLLSHRTVHSVCDAGGAAKLVISGVGAISASSRS